MEGMTLGQLVRHLRDQRGLTQGQLAIYAKVERSWLSVVEIDRVKQPGRDRLERLARVLDVPAETLLAAAGYEVGRAPERRERTPEEIMLELQAAIRREREEAVYAVPVEGIASAGPGAYQDEHAYVGQAQLRPELRRLVVTGDCMKGTIEPGDVVIVDIEASYREGQIVAARRGDQVIVKRFHGEELRGDDGRVERTSDWTIVGVVVVYQRGLN